MNRTKIDWADYTWNPIVGCSRGCPYCYAKRINDRFHYIEDFSEPQFFPERLGEPAKVKKPSWIFTCSMGDFFNPPGCRDWQDKVMAAMCKAPQHKYVILTKRPGHMAEYIKNNGLKLIGETGPIGGAFFLPDTLFLGMSVDMDVNYPTWVHAEPALRPLRGRRVLCAEPLLGPLPSFVASLRAGAQYLSTWPFDWLIIGAQTGPGAVKPKPEWIMELVDAADAAGIPIWTKDNLKGICPETHWRRQKPKERP